MITELSRLTGITEAEILGSSKRADIVDVRHIYWHLMFRKGFSYSLIGRLCDNDHSSVIYGIKRVERLLMIRDKQIVGLYELTKNIEKMSDLNSVLEIAPPNLSQAKRGEIFVSRGHRCPYCNGLGYASPEQVSINEWKDNTCTVCKGSGRLTAKIVVGWEAESK